MKLSGVILATCVALAGCGGAPVGSPAAAGGKADSIPGEVVTTQNLTTGLGAPVNVSVVAGNVVEEGEDSGYAFDTPMTFTITYTDAKDYFGSTNTVTAFIRFHTHQRYRNDETSSQKPTDVLVSLQPVAAGGLDAYQGSYTFTLKGYEGDDVQVIDGIDLAFNANGKWDSNEGRNYSLPLDIEQ